MWWTTPRDAAAIPSRGNTSVCEPPRGSTTERANVIILPALMGLQDIHRLRSSRRLAFLLFQDPKQAAVVVGPHAKA
jgi:hypothetical protein